MRTLVGVTEPNDDKTNTRFVKNPIQVVHWQPGPVDVRRPETSMKGEGGVYGHLMRLR